MPSLAVRRGGVGHEHETKRPDDPSSTTDHPSTHSLVARKENAKIMKPDALKLAEYARNILQLKTASLSPAYYYQSMPICIVDAVFSIGVRYEQVEGVVSRLSQAVGWKTFRDYGSPTPPLNEQKTVSEFLELLKGYSSAMETLFKNRCFANPGASKASRIRKADLVRMFAETLKANQVESFKDLGPCADLKGLEQCLLRLPALKTGVAVRYFWMLAGDENEVKPDRMIHRFITGALGRVASNAEAVKLIREACVALNHDYPKLNPRILDHEIWKHQRTQCGIGSGRSRKQI